MCGRFTLYTDSDTISSHFSIDKGFVLKPRYNICPSNAVPILRENGLLEFITWGFKPKWLPDKFGNFINARVETISEKPVFKKPIAKQRCLIIADGYYEWKLINTKKQPFYITYDKNKVFAFAGIWDNDGCAIITQQSSNISIKKVHDRMPIILPKNSYQHWINPQCKKSIISNILSSSFKEKINLNVYPVSKLVNNPIFEGVSCIQPLH